MRLLAYRWLHCRAGGLWMQNEEGAIMPRPHVGAGGEGECALDPRFVEYNALLNDTLSDTRGV